MRRLLGLHRDIALMNATSPESEGQFAQDLYPNAHDMGGMRMWPRHKAAHTDNSSSLITDANRARLYAAWRPFWDLSKCDCIITLWMTC